MNNASSTSPSKINMEQIKKYLIIATIALVTACAFLAIIALFVGSKNHIVLKLLSTLLIMYLVLVYSTNNIVRLSHPNIGVRFCSGAALIANFFWSILWILLVWDAFSGLSVYTRETIWKIVGSAAVISVFCTVLAALIPRIAHYPAVIKFYKSLPLVCVGFVGIDLLLMIWIPSMDAELFVKFVFAECILLALQWIVTQILISNASRLGINTAGGSQDHPSIPNPSTTVTETDAPESPQPQAEQSSQPATAANTQPAPTQKGHTSFLTIIGIIVLVWIGLSIVLPAIIGLIGMFLSLVFHL